MLGAIFVIRPFKEFARSIRDPHRFGRTDVIGHGVFVKRQKTLYFEAMYSKRCK